MANCVGGTSPVCSSNGRCDITQYDTSLDAEVGGVSGGEPRSNVIRFRA